MGSGRVRGPDGRKPGAAFVAADHGLGHDGEAAHGVGDARGGGIHSPLSVPARHAVPRRRRADAAPARRRRLAALHRPAVDRGRRLDVSTAERFTEPVAYHGEGPFWDAVQQRLLLVDMLAGAIVEIDARGAASRHDYGTIAAVVRARRDGGYLLAQQSRVLLLKPDLTE